MANDLIVARMDSARTALIEADTPLQLKAVIDAAEAARIYAQRQRLGVDIIAHATSIRFDAERKLGGILEATPKRGTEHSTGGGSKGSSRVPLPNAPPTLADLGIDKKTSARAQSLAKLPDAAFDAVRTGSISPAKAISAQSPPKPKKPRPIPEPSAEAAEILALRDEVDMVREGAQEAVMQASAAQELLASEPGVVLLSYKREIERLERLRNDLMNERAELVKEVKMLRRKLSQYEGR